MPTPHVADSVINDAPEPSGLYPVERVGVYAGSFVPFFDVVAIPSSNPSMGGLLRLTGLAGHGLLVQWEDPVGGRIWECEFVGKGLKEMAQ